MYLLFILERNQFIKTNQDFCDVNYKTTDTLDEAIEICAGDEDCTVFNSDTCDDTGPFRLCSSKSNVNGTSFGNCAYVKEGKIAHEKATHPVNALL